MFGGAKSGSASSSSFAEFLEGSFGKSTARSSDSPYSEDVPAVFYQPRSRTSEQAGQSANEQGTQSGCWFETPDGRSERRLGGNVRNGEHVWEGRCLDGLV